jgi:peptidoglycan/LPS O-acetylase OafA/YrhL
MKNTQIETLRGLACLLLVLYHVIGADASFGLGVQDGALRWFNDGLVYLRMPLFTFLSGLVYGLRPFAGDSRAFLAGKARRLLIPMLVVGSLFAILQTLSRGSSVLLGPWYLIHLMPVAHYWFVESLFWVFVLVWALERLDCIAAPVGFGLVLAFVCALSLTVRGPHWLGLEGAIYLSPYFLVGLAVTRFSMRTLLGSVWVRMVLTLLALGAVLCMGTPVPNPDRRTVLMLVVGVSSCLLLLSLDLVSRRLSSVGRYSFAIYLFHVFFTAFARLALTHLGFDELLLHIGLGLALGIAGPMALEWLVSHHRWPTLLLLGRSVRRPTDTGIRPARVVTVN